MVKGNKLKFSPADHCSEIKLIFGLGEWLPFRGLTFLCLLWGLDRWWLSPYQSSVRTFFRSFIYSRNICWPSLVSASMLGPENTAGQWQTDHSLCVLLTTDRHLIPHKHIQMQKIMLTQYQLNSHARHIYKTRVSEYRSESSFQVSEQGSTTCPFLCSAIFNT